MDNNENKDLEQTNETNDEEQLVPAVVEEPEAETVEAVDAEVMPTPEEAQAQINEINKQIQGIMKKYKMTMWGMIACIVVYLIALFWLKNMIVVLICCIPMVAMAVLNSRYSKQARALMQKRQEIKNREDARIKREQALASGDMDAAAAAQAVINNEPIIANASSLNDLPKEYTVLDDVVVDGETIPHVILSPYGVAVVDEADRTDLMHGVLEELSLDAPVYMYEPDENIAELAEQIQMPKTVALSEPEIYSILSRLTGLNLPH